MHHFLILHLFFKVLLLIIGQTFNICTGMRIPIDLSPIINARQNERGNQKRKPLFPFVTNMHSRRFRIPYLSHLYFK